MPYIALVIVVHLATVVLLWHVMVRSKVDPWVALCFVTVFAVLGTGYENLTNAWQVTLVAPLALGLAAILVVPESGPFAGRDAVAAAFMTIAMMCSGVALPMLLAWRSSRSCGEDGGWRSQPPWFRRPHTPSGTWRTAVTVLPSPKQRPERCRGSSGTGSPMRSATWPGSRRSA